jgi:hypothetical protein
MRVMAVALSLALSMLSGAALAQSGPPGPPPPESGAPPPQSGPPPGPPPQSGPPPQRGSITRDQYIQNAVQRANNRHADPQLAAQRAGARFDQIDTGHAGVLTRSQMRAWRAGHSRPAGPGQPSPAQQQ